jgi:hypothetical protein
VFKLAIREKRIVITHNRRDFEALHQAMPWHTGIAILGRLEEGRESLDEFAEAHGPHESNLHRCGLWETARQRWGQQVWGR